MKKQIFITNFLKEDLPSYKKLVKLYQGLASIQPARGKENQKDCLSLYLNKKACRKHGLAILAIETCSIIECPSA